MSEKLRKQAINGLILKLASDDMGIYCRAVTGGSRPYEKRNAYQEGWNAYGSELLEKRGKISDWFKSLNGSRTLVEDLLLDHKIELSIESDGTKMWVNCSDVFWWGCADAEEITLEELPALLACYDEVGAGGELWCCRKRKMRPQTASYEECYPPKDWPIFDLSGPERDDSDGKRRPQVENYERHQRERAERLSKT